MGKLNAMNAHVKVVMPGSYPEAGRGLSVTRRAVSKAVMELYQVRRACSTASHGASARQKPVSPITTDA